MSGTVLSVPVYCIATKGVGSARSCLCSTLGTVSAHYKWLPCHGHCGIQINKTGADVSKQLLPHSHPCAHSSSREHVKVGKCWQRGALACDLRAAAAARNVPSISPSLQQMQKARNDCPGIGCSSWQVDSICLETPAAVSPAVWVAGGSQLWGQTPSLRLRLEKR